MQLHRIIALLKSSYTYVLSHEGKPEPQNNIPLGAEEPRTVLYLA